jgi:hypothetical protein
MVDGLTNEDTKKMMFATVAQLVDRDLFVGILFSCVSDEKGFDHWSGKPVTNEYDTEEDALSHLKIMYPNLDILY